MMITLITKEHEESKEEVRKVNYALAYALATKGGFYSAQIINEFGVIEVEVKSSRILNT